MTEFKVGDRVRVTNENFDEYGHIGTVTAVSKSPASSWPYRVMIDDPAFGAGRYAASELAGPVTTSHVVVDDSVHQPKHYTSHPSGIEAIDVTEWFGFNLGNAIKYIWRADHKGNPLKDLEKAAWYVNRELERRKKHPKSV